MPKTPRSERFWKPPTNFDRPPLTLTTTELLEGIPEHLWDTPQFSDGETPRQKAQHVSEGNCGACRTVLFDLKARLA